MELAERVSRRHADQNRQRLARAGQIGPVVLSAQTRSIRLSRREVEVLNHIRLGFTNRQIAQRLFVSTNTINKHVHQVLRKLEVSNRVQAAVYPSDSLNQVLGLVDPLDQVWGT